MKRVWLVWAGEQGILIDAYDNEAAANARADRLNRRLDRWDEAMKRLRQRFATLDSAGLELDATAWVRPVTVRSR